MSALENARRTYPSVRARRIFLTSLIHFLDLETKQARPSLPSALPDQVPALV